VAPDSIESIADSVIINASPSALYDMLADVTRMGEWSSACTGATWDDGAGPTARESTWFTGHNLDGDRAYDTHCQITAAERPLTVAWMANGRVDGYTEWRYRFEEVDSGTKVTESWTLIRPFPPERVDDELLKTIRTRFEATIQETLTRLQARVEAPSG
jgi:Polyketide cyclase / dehydrase and lipid transport